MTLFFKPANLRLFPLILLILVLLSFRSSSVDKIMMKMESQSLHRGKVVNVDAWLYFESLTGRMVTRYENPAGNIMVSNDKGEVSVYDQDENTVSYEQGAEYSTESSMVHFFLQGKTQDMGLSDFGFQQMSTEFENGLTITEWFPPASLYHLYNRIELVHENFLPIYAAYYDAQRNLAKKVFYAEYEHLGDVSIPTLITEFNYIENDSIINRIRFSEIKTNHQAQSPWFDFEIPDDAKLDR